MYIYCTDVRTGLFVGYSASLTELLRLAVRLKKDNNERGWPNILELAELTLRWPTALRKEFP